MKSSSSCGTSSDSESSNSEIEQSRFKRNDNLTLPVEKSIPKQPQPPELLASIPSLINPEILATNMQAWPQDLHDPLALFYTHSNKTYIKGFMYIKHALSQSGADLSINDSMTSPASTQSLDRGEEWSKWWVELTGECLYCWKVDEEIAALSYKPEPSLAQMMALELDLPADETLSMIKKSLPVGVNISDALIELLPFPTKLPHFGHSFPPPPPPYTNFIILNTSGQNLYVLAISSSIQANAWVNAIRLSVWEVGKVCELYTRRLLERPQLDSVWEGFGMKDFDFASRQAGIEFEGVLQVNFGFSSEWKSFWCVLTSKLLNEGESADTVDEQHLPDQSPPNLAKKLFFKQRKKTLSNNEPSTLDRPEQPAKHKYASQLLLYESKKELKRGARPLFHVPFVSAVYALWPDTADAIANSKAHIGKIEGCVIPVPQIPTESAAKRESKTKKREVAIPKYTNGVQFGGCKSLHDYFLRDNISHGRVRRVPTPQHLFISVSSSSELRAWIVGIMSGFGIFFAPWSGMLANGCVGFLKQEIIVQQSAAGDKSRARSNEMSELRKGSVGTMGSGSGKEKSDLESLYEDIADGVRKNSIPMVDNAPASISDKAIPNTDRKSSAGSLLKSESDSTVERFRKSSTTSTYIKPASETTVESIRKLSLWPLNDGSSAGSRPISHIESLYDEVATKAAPSVVERDPSRAYSSDVTSSLNADDSSSKSSAAATESVASPCQKSPTVPKLVATNIPWGLLFLSIYEISGVEVVRTTITAANPVSADATCRAIFESILRDKARFYESSRLDQWNMSVGQAEAGRRLFERRQVENKLRELVVWYKSIRNILAQSGEFDLKVEFLQEDNSGVAGDSWGVEGQRYLLRAVPCFMADGQLFWLYRHVNSVLFEQHMKIYRDWVSGKRASVMPPRKLNKRDEVRVKGKNDDSLVGGYIASEDSESDGVGEESGSESDDDRPIVNDTKINGDVDSSSDHGVYLSNTLPNQMMNSRASRLPESSDDEGNFPHNSLLAKKSDAPDTGMAHGKKVTLEDAPKVFEDNSLLARVKALKEHQALMVSQHQAYNEDDGPLLGNVDKDSHRITLQAGLLGEMGRREKEREQMKKLGYYQALQPAQGMFQGFPPQMYPNQFTPLQHPSSQFNPSMMGQFPPGMFPHQMQQFQPPGQYPPLYPQFYLPGMMHQSAIPQTQIPEMVFGPQHSQPALGAHLDSDALKRQALKDQFLEQERAKEWQRMNERSQEIGKSGLGAPSLAARMPLPPAFDARSFSDGGSDERKLDASSGTESVSSDDDLPISQLAKRANYDSSDDEPLAGIGASKGHSIESDDDDVPLRVSVDYKGPSMSPRALYNPYQPQSYQNQSSFGLQQQQQQQAQMMMSQHHMMMQNQHQYHNQMMMHAVQPNPMFYNNPLQQHQQIYNQEMLHQQYPVQQQQRPVAKDSTSGEDSSDDEPLARR